MSFIRRHGNWPALVVLRVAFQAKNSRRFNFLHERVGLRLAQGIRWNSHERLGEFILLTFLAWLLICILVHFPIISHFFIFYFVHFSQYILLFAFYLVVLVETWSHELKHFMESWIDLSGFLSGMYKVIVLNFRFFIITYSIFFGYCYFQPIWIYRMYLKKFWTADDFQEIETSNACPYIHTTQLGTTQNLQRVPR